MMLNLFQMSEFEKELRELRQKSSSMKVDIGPQAHLEALKRESDQMVRFCKDICDTTKVGFSESEFTLVMLGLYVADIFLSWRAKFFSQFDIIMNVLAVRYYKFLILLVRESMLKVLNSLYSVNQILKFIFHK